MCKKRYLNIEFLIFDLMILLLKLILKKKKVFLLVINYIYHHKVQEKKNQKLILKYQLFLLICINLIQLVENYLKKISDKLKKKIIYY